jgi:hypothetical protein
MVETLRKRNDLGENWFEIPAHKTEVNPFPSFRIDIGFNGWFVLFLRFWAINYIHTVPFIYGINANAIHDNCMCGLKSAFAV